MMALDIFWTTNPDWYEDDINLFGHHYDRLKESASPEARKVINAISLRLDMLQRLRRKQVDI